VWERFIVNKPQLFRTRVREVFAEYQQGNDVAHAGRDPYECPPPPPVCTACACGRRHTRKRNCTACDAVAPVHDDVHVAQRQQGRCPLCGVVCRQGKGFSQHLIRDHDVRPRWRVFAGESAKCTACLMVFSTRVRLMAHLAGKGSKGNACFRHLVLTNAPQYTPDEVRYFENKQNEVAKALKRKGRSANTTTQVCYRLSGPMQTLQDGPLPPAWRAPTLLPLVVSGRALVASDTT